MNKGSTARRNTTCSAARGPSDESPKAKRRRLTENKSSPLSVEFTPTKTSCTTSSVCLDGTPNNDHTIGQSDTNVDVTTILFCNALSGVLFRIFHESSGTNQQYSYQFCQSQSSIPPLPSLQEIRNFVFRVVVESQMDFSCAIVALIYIVRAISCHSRHQGSCHLITGANWRSILLASFVVGGKLLDDFCMPNQDFVDIFQRDLIMDSNTCVIEPLTVQHLNAMEIQLLKAVGFAAFISNEEYQLFSSIVDSEIEIIKCLEKPLANSIDTEVIRSYSSPDCNTESGLKSDHKRESIPIRGPGRLVEVICETHAGIYSS
mmetsp:Transcript_20908/g.30107  ORF Transcript_20908/g.30107 Transcript_20908/m.30107 type:complete len:318 (-) Transcript_20908:173-1126(-)